MTESTGPSKSPGELKGMWVSVDQVEYQPEAETPPDRPYCFIYHITIHNDSDRTVAIKGRKWVVTNERDDVLAVEGDGVVGEKPTLKPGEEFNYSSYHLLDTHSAIAEGSYLGMDDKGKPFYVRIPAFPMTVPN